MKHAFFATLLLVHSPAIRAQHLPAGVYGQNFVYPDAANRFIQSGHISWALNTEQTVSFAGQQKPGKENIFDYLVRNVRRGRLKAYYQQRAGFEGFNKRGSSGLQRFFFSGADSAALQQLANDTSRNISFHEIFYLDRYVMKCRILSAAPLAEYATAGGRPLGTWPVFRCGRNTSYQSAARGSKYLLHLKKIQRTLHPDSAGSARLLKQSYGLNAAQAIWLGASMGRVKLFDAVQNRVMPAAEVLNWPGGTEQRTAVPVYDTTGSISTAVIRSVQPVFPGMLSGAIQFDQDIYYDPARQVFLSTITNCWLLIKKPDQNNDAVLSEKRFRVL